MKRKRQFLYYLL